MSVSSTITKVGKLNSICEFQRKIFETDEFGFSTDKWETIKKTRCKVDFDDRLNRIRASDDGVDTIITKIFTLRYAPNITAKDRIIYDKKIFDIYSIHYDEKKRFMKIWARINECSS